MNDNETESLINTSRNYSELSSSINEDLNFSIFKDLDDKKKTKIINKLNLSICKLNNTIELNNSEIQSLSQDFDNINDHNFVLQQSEFESIILLNKNMDHIIELIVKNKNELVKYMTLYCDVNLIKVNVRCLNLLFLNKDDNDYRATYALLENLDDFNEIIQLKTKKVLFLDENFWKICHNVYTKNLKIDSKLDLNENVQNIFINLFKLLKKILYDLMRIKELKLNIQSNENKLNELEKSKLKLLKNSYYLSQESNRLKYKLSQFRCENTDNFNSLIEYKQNLYLDELKLKSQISNNDSFRDEPYMNSSTYQESVQSGNNYSTVRMCYMEESDIVNKPQEDLLKAMKRVVTFEEDQVNTISDICERIHTKKINNKNKIKNCCDINI